MLWVSALILSSVSAVSYRGNEPDTPFRIVFNEAGITSLKRAHDSYDTEYIRSGGVLGDIVIRYQMENGKWQEETASSMADRRGALPPTEPETLEYSVAYLDRYYLYHADFNDHYSDLELILRYRASEDGLYWTIHLRNLSDKPLTIGDLLIPLPFNTQVRWTKNEMYTRRLIPHVFVSGHGSFAFWMRPNSVGPFLMMIPLQRSPDPETEERFRPTWLEYFDDRGIYIHSTVTGREDREMGGNWRQKNTSVTLMPRQSPGSQVLYGFKFFWIDDYEAVRAALYREGQIDIHVVPGMTVPQDLEARFSLRTKNQIRMIDAEHPEHTELEYLGEQHQDTHIYRIEFSRLGENMLTVNYGTGRKMQLEFFVTEPLEILIKKRAAHLAFRQQHRNPDKWYNGLFSDWDMRNQVLRGPEDTDGLKMFWLTCDDPGNCKAPYIAAKNVFFPIKEEVEAVEYYIRHYLWGGMQRTDEEDYAYGIYGIPNWKVHRESKPEDRDGWVGHLWRLADYPHIIMLYLNMYRIARYYPGMTGYLDKAGYLQRAFGTARAYFTVPYETGGWSTYELCRMNEMIIVPLIETLEFEGRPDQAGWLRRAWEKKVAHYVNDGPNLLHAEYPGNPCAFESTQALARYAIEHVDRIGFMPDVSREDAERFLHEQIAINIALRGWIEPAYYLLGSSRPGTMFYMSQMAGWSIVDFALYFSMEPEKYLRLGYASFLCNWALMNTGTAATGYGYWYPGHDNDGGAGGAFIPFAIDERQGKVSPRGTWYYGGEADMGFGAALRTAATIVVDDPLFGLYAYGGSLTRVDGDFDVIPKDGLRRRFHVLLGGRRIFLELDRDGFAAGRSVVFPETLDSFRFHLENRTQDAHTTTLKSDGLPPGTYAVSLDGSVHRMFEVGEDRENILELPVRSKASMSVVISRTGEASPPGNSDQRRKH
jgi:hypothetical protein